MWENFYVFICKRSLLYILILFFSHSQKKKCSLETCAWLLFMLLQDFFTSARLHKKFLSAKSAVHYSYYLQLNNVIAQRKTTNLQEHFYPWLISFWSMIFLCIANTCKWQKFTVHTVQTGLKCYHARDC